MSNRKTGNTSEYALDIDDVQTQRQQKKGQNQSSKIQIKFILTHPNASNNSTLQRIETPSTNQFEITNKPKTRAERRSEDEEDHEVPAEVSFAKRQRRTDFWIVQDTLRINRSRRLKQLERDIQEDGF